MESTRHFRNPRASAGLPYGEREAVLSEAGFAAARREISSWEDYAATPLPRLDGLAQALGLGALFLKDEAGRFGLGSFKALGGAYAVGRVARSAAPPVTVACATDGNHGRAVAWGARRFGCRCVVFVHQGVSQSRRDAIARFGADIVEAAGTYDDSVRQAEAAARRNGWIVVSDTSYPGYEEIPRDVMHGYGVMADEAAEQLAGEVPTHVLVQAGVGAWAAAVCARFWQRFGARRPRFLVVEPLLADGLFRSAVAGRPVAAEGGLGTVMAGLACAEASLLGWRILEHGADDFLAIDDEWALRAMRRLAEPEAGDPPVVAGETGAAGVAALLAARADGLYGALGLGPAARVLVFGSEGATDPEIYRTITGRSAEEVRQR